MRISLSISENSLERIDSFCKNRGMTRSGFFEYVANQHIDAVEMLPEVQKQLDDLKEQLSKLK